MRILPSSFFRRILPFSPSPPRARPAENMAVDEAISQAIAAVVSRRCKLRLGAALRLRAAAPACGGR